MMDTYAGLTFWHSVEGASSYPGGLAFTHSVAGKSTITLSATLGICPSLKNRVAYHVLIPVKIGLNPKLSDKVTFNIKRSVSLGITPNLVVELNVGYQDIVKFGSLILRRAKKAEKTKLPLSCRSADIHDGTEALEVDPVRGYYAKFYFFPITYEDIQALYDMVGTHATLRVWGVPHRNCVIWDEIEEEQFKQGAPYWRITVTFKEDTCKTGITS